MSQNNTHADMMPSCYEGSRLRCAKFSIPVFSDAHRRVQVEEKKKELVRRNFSQQLNCLTLSSKRADERLQAELESKVKGTESK